MIYQYIVEVIIGKRLIFTLADKARIKMIKRTAINNLLISGLWIMISCGCQPSASPETGYRFDFGPGESAPGFTRVTADRIYTGESAYGFLEGANLHPNTTAGKDPLLSDFITSDEPFIFALDVPEGNYDVRVTLGDPEVASVSTLKAESRRLMVERLETTTGKVASVMFTTNVRCPELDGGGNVSLKPRENGHFSWDKRLTIEFNGDRPQVCALEVTPNDSAVTVFLAGNSTVTDQRYEPWSAWGQMLPRFFKPGFISVANHAESGEALKSFIAENRLEKLMGMIRPGDYLFIQFAHNDQKPNNSAYVEAFTGYKEYLKLYIEEARSRGAIPVLVTSMLRRNFNDQGEVVNTHGDYPAAMRQVAAEEQVALIDLFDMSKTLYEALGPEDSKTLFVHYPGGSFPGQEEELKDNSHHSTYGAYELAKCIVKGIRENVPALADYLLEDLPPFDPAEPGPYDQWALPISPAFDIERPAGR